MTEMSVRIKDKDHLPLMPIAFWTASVDEHLQKLGAESFDRFQRCVFPGQLVTCSDILYKKLTGGSTTWIKR
jgi:hypothetical protein